MADYWLVRLGRGNVYSQEAYEGEYVGANWFPDIDLTSHLSGDFRSFADEMIPKHLSYYPERSRTSAGLGCGNLWTVTKGMKLGDTLLMPRGNGDYAIGEVAGDYRYRPGAAVPHQRPVRWIGSVAKTQMSSPLQGSAGAIMTAFSLTKHGAEISSFVGELPKPSTPDAIGEVEDATTFALEKQLEEFLISNWNSTSLATEYEIFAEDGETLGQQYPTDTGPIDILAISKDKKRLLVIELKRGRASDRVVGQIQRYMGYVKDEIATEEQSVSGLIIALEDDLRVRRALSVTTNIEFMTYKVSFTLQKIY